MEQNHSLARTVRRLSLALGVLALLASFGLPAHPAAAAPSPSFVRIIHASPFVGTADVFVDGAKLLSSFAFGTVTDYATIPPGPHKVQIALVGKGIGASALTETLTVNAGTAYTVAAIGTQASTLSLQVFVDNNVLATGTTKLRVYQLSPDAGSMTVAAGGHTLVNGISYQNASTYLVLAAGAYTFAATSPTNNATLSTAATLEANKVASLFVVGMFTSTPKSALVTAQAAGLPGVPNTGSDPTAISHTNTAHSLPPWSWPLGLASLLLSGGGIFLRKVIVRRSERSR
jgi:hypothetical protein